MMATEECLPYIPNHYALSHGNLLICGEIGDSGEAVRVRACFSAG